MSEELRTPRTELGRHAERGLYDRALIYAILDEAIYCHLGIVREGMPIVLPTLHARLGDQLYLHGAAQSRLLADGRGHQVCVTVTLLDGLVLARSAFHHSLNYRSVVVLGEAIWVDELAEKQRALQRLVEHVLPRRSADCRPPSAEELQITGVLRLALNEASAKIRSGPPIDAPKDRELGHWGGVLPLRLVAGEAQPDSLTTSDCPLPEYLHSYTREVRS